MRFGLNDEQRLLRDSVGGWLAQNCTLDGQVRPCAEAGHSMDEQVWAGLVEQGIAGLLVPEDHGGVGLGFLDMAVVAQLLGAQVAPVPFVASLVMAPVAVRLAASKAQKAAWLPSIADGSRRFAVAVSEATGAREDAGVRVDNGKLHGRALFALDTGAATDLLVATSDQQLFRVDLPGTTRDLDSNTLTTVDRTRSCAEFVFAGTQAERLPDADAAVLAEVVRAGRLALAADALGAGQTMLAKAVAYAGERRQFNRVIASFQAVKHMCAEMAAELEPCQSLVWYAAHAMDAVPEEAPVMVCHAKAHLAEVGRFVAKTATEVHGGMGFTDLMGLHYWFKRIGANRQWLGSPERVRAEAAVLQGW